jgi:hypothetical protein
MTAHHARRLSGNAFEIRSLHARRRSGGAWIEAAAVALLAVTLSGCGSAKGKFEVIVAGQMTACMVDHCAAYLLITPLNPTSVAPAQPETQIVGLTIVTTIQVEPRQLPAVPHLIRARQVSEMPDGSLSTSAMCEATLNPPSVDHPGTAFVDLTYAGDTCAISVRYATAGSTPPS